METTCGLDDSVVSVTSSEDIAVVIKREEVLAECGAAAFRNGAAKHETCAVQHAKINATKATVFIFKVGLCM